MAKEIKFIPKYVSPILEEEKTLTVRHGWKDNDKPEIGEKLYLTESNTLQNFSIARTTDVYEMTIEEFAMQDWKGHRNYESPADMIWALGHFYDEDKISPETEVTVIEWELY